MKERVLSHCTYSVQLLNTIQKEYLLAVQDMAEHDYMFRVLPLEKFCSSWWMWTKTFFSYKLWSFTLKRCYGRWFMTCTHSVWQHASASGPSVFLSWLSCCSVLAASLLCSSSFVNHGFSKKKAVHKHCFLFINKLKRQVNLFLVAALEIWVKLDFYMSLLQYKSLKYQNWVPS